ncbi:MAG: YqgE/AlgH family protein [Bacteroidota bacterium]
MDLLKPGTLLISDPFLKDPNFLRTVVLLCEHQDEGSFGLVLNKPLDITLEDVMPEAAGLPIPLLEGGPVQKDTLHILHCRPDLIADSIEVSKHVFWGGNFSEILMLLRSKKLLPNDLRFFIGYSGWAEQQLQSELNEKSWITRAANKNLVFHTEAMAIWKNALADLGGEYSQMINYPIDPQLN